MPPTSSGSFVDGSGRRSRRDVLHEGPCPPVDGDAWHEVRARFLASATAGRRSEIKAALAARRSRRSPTRARRGDEIVLWFEHDLFDQLALIRTLDLDRSG